MKHELRITNYELQRASSPLPAGEGLGEGQLWNLVFLTVAIVTITNIATPIAAAEDSFGAGVCIAEIDSRLAREQRLYRSVLFGLPRAADEPDHTLRFDRDGDPWFKIQSNTWVSAQNPGLTWSDTQMDLQSEWPMEPLSGSSSSSSSSSSSAHTRRGIFETKGALTSDLVPALTQSFRALHCRTAILCRALEESAERKDLPIGEKLRIEVPGCAPMEVPVLRSCQNQVTIEGSSRQTNAPREGIIHTYCGGAAEKLLSLERERLKTAVAYDAAYRSLLQFSGIVDTFVARLRASFLAPIREAVSVLGALGRIPCFLSECNE